MRSQTILDLDGPSQASILGGTAKKVISSSTTRTSGSLVLVTSISALTVLTLPLTADGGPFTHTLAV